MSEARDGRWSDCSGGRRTIRILFAGGCHVEGFPVGQENSFPVIAAEILRRHGWIAEVETVSYIALHHPGKVAGAIEGMRPDVLVMQVGHFEQGPIRVRDLILSREGKKDTKPRAENPSSRRPGTLLPESYPALGLRLKAILRWPLEPWIRKESERRLGFGRKFRPFCDAIAEVWNGPCLLLSPLPAACPTVMRLRQSCLEKYREAAASRGWGFLDVLTAPPRWNGRRLGLAEFHADGSHLGRQGQKWLGERVGEALLRVLPRPFSGGQRQVALAGGPATGGSR